MREELKEADIILPSLDAYDEKSYKLINRPHGSIHFKETIEGLQEFSSCFNGQIWIETMLIKGINDDENSLNQIRSILNTIKYDRLYINTPVRSPAEVYVQEVTSHTIDKAIEVLNGISIDQLVSEGFYSEIQDDYAAIESIIRRHPMNQYEIEHFLISRKCKNIQEIFSRLKQDEKIEVIEYKNYETYRIK